MIRIYFSRSKGHFCAPQFIAVTPPLIKQYFILFLARVPTPFTQLPCQFFFSILSLLSPTTQWYSPSTVESWVSRPVGLWTRLREEFSRIGRVRQRNQNINHLKSIQVMNRGIKFNVGSFLTDWQCIMGWYLKLLLFWIDEDAR